MTTKAGSADSREMALEALLLILEQGEMSHLVISRALSKYQYLDKRDRAFFTRLTEGTLERLLTLDDILGRYSSVPVEKMKPVIRMILRMGAYQLLYMDGVPDSAACNESVRLAQKKGFKSLKGFVNGVLRSIARERESVLDPAGMSLSVRYSVPAWIASLWADAYGEETAETMLKASLQDRRTTVRFDPGRITREELIRMLGREQIAAEPCAWPDCALTLSGYDYLEGLTAFKEGYISVQDVSSMLVALAAGIRPGFQVLDVCAAPGGKSLHAAELLLGTGHVEARDLTEKKTALIEENIERTGLENIAVKVWDALVYDKEWEQRADVVLADLPCSGLGVIGKKNDLKYRITESACAELVRLQRQIAGTVSRYVKPGGCLIYSTCTLNPAENQENAAWIESNLPLEAESLLPYLPEGLKAALPDKTRKEAEKGFLTILPGILPADGFFLARFRRKGISL